jgi:predicted nucleotidyltransferase
MRASEFVTEKWSKKYKQSIDCSNPRGFSQRAHCQGRKKNEDIEENFADSKKSVVDAVQKVMPSSQEIWFHGSRATGKHRKNSDTDILVVVPDDLVGDQYLAAVRTLQKLSAQFNNYDIQPTKSGTNIHRIAQEEGQLLWSTTNENFADGKKPGRKGLAKRSGVNCKQSVSKLRSIAANSSGERQRMAHWCANMKSGRK